MCIRFIPLLIKGTLLTTSGWGKLGRLAFCLIFFMSICSFFISSPPPPLPHPTQLKKILFFSSFLYTIVAISESTMGGRGHSM